MSDRARLLIVYALLAGIGFAVYWPCLAGEFLWDDTDWIVENETLRSFGGLLRIWFEPGAVIQYYPLTYTSWWLDYQHCLVGHRDHLNPSYSGSLRISRHRSRRPYRRCSSFSS